MTASVLYSKLSMSLNDYETSASLSKKLASCGVIISSKTMANNDADKKKEGIKKSSISRNKVYYEKNDILEWVIKKFGA